LVLEFALDRVFFESPFFSQVSVSEPSIQAEPGKLPAFRIPATLSPRLIFRPRSPPSFLDFFSVITAGLKKMTIRQPPFTGPPCVASPDFLSLPPSFLFAASLTDYFNPVRFQSRSVAYQVHSSGLPHRLPLFPGYCAFLLMLILSSPMGPQMRPLVR